MGLISLYPIFRAEDLLFAHRPSFCHLKPFRKFENNQNRHASLLFSTVISPQLKYRPEALKMFYRVDSSVVVSSFLGRSPCFLFSKRNRY